MENCKIHGTPFVLHPAGVSKKTGKPFAAFWSCPEKNADGSFCKEKPSANTPTTGREVAVNKFEQEIKQDLKNQATEKETIEKQENISRSVALNGAVAFASAVCSHYDRFSDYELLKDEVLEVAENFYDWLRKENK